MYALLLVALLLPPQDDAKQLQAVFDTTAGNFIVEFYPDQAPHHVRSFIDLAQQGFYNGTIFHSMVPHGILQEEIRKPKIRRHALSMEQAGSTLA